MSATSRVGCSDALHPKIVVRVIEEAVISLRRSAAPFVMTLNLFRRIDWYQDPMAEVDSDRRSWQSEVA
jgi:hypothetical protein